MGPCRVVAQITRSYVAPEDVRPVFETLTSTTGELNKHVTSSHAALRVAADASNEWELPIDGRYFHGCPAVGPHGALLDTAWLHDTDTGSESIYLALVTHPKISDVYNPQLYAGFDSVVSSTGVWVASGTRRGSATTYQPFDLVAYILGDDRPTDILHRSVIIGRSGHVSRFVPPLARYPDTTDQYDESWFVPPKQPGSDIDFDTLAASTLVSTMYIVVRG